MSSSRDLFADSAAGDKPSWPPWQGQCSKAWAAAENAAVAGVAAAAAGSSPGLAASASGDFDWRNELAAVRAGDNARVERSTQVRGDGLHLDGGQVEGPSRGF